MDDQELEELKAILREVGASSEIQARSWEVISGHMGDDDSGDDLNNADGST